ncbi:ABC transporter substrate-binding protein, partial [Candidatus Phytoplasma meliae]
IIVICVVVNHKNKIKKEEDIKKQEETKLLEKQKEDKQKEAEIKRQAELRKEQAIKTSPKLPTVGHNQDGSINNIIEYNPITNKKIKLTAYKTVKTIAYIKEFDAQEKPEKETQENFTPEQQETASKLYQQYEEQAKQQAEKEVKDKQQAEEAAQTSLTVEREEQQRKKEENREESIEVSSSGSSDSQQGMRVYKKGFLLSNSQTLSQLEMNPFATSSSNNSFKKEVFSHVTIPFVNMHNSKMDATRSLCETTISDDNLKNHDLGVTSTCDQLQSINSKSYIFTLRNDIKFSDNQSIAIKDVLFSLEELKKVQTKNKLKIDAVPSEPNKMKVSFDNNKPNQLYTLSQTISSLNEIILVPEETYNNSLSQDTDGKSRSSYGTDNNYFTSYGPYVVEMFNTDHSLFTLTKNPQFQAADIHNDKIEIHLSNDKAKLEKALQEGTIHEYNNRYYPFRNNQTLFR